MTFLSIIFLVFLHLGEGTVLYNLDFLNPAFVLYGSDFQNASSAIIALENETDWIQLNGLFNDFIHTDFFFFGSDKKQYTPKDLQQSGPKGLRVLGTIQFFMAKNTSNDFYISFSLYPGDDKAASYGYDDYTLSLFDINYKIPPFYDLTGNSTTARMITVINKQYSKDSCYDFEMQNIQILNPFCSLKIYVGGAPGWTSGILYLLYEIKGRDLYGFTPPTLSAAYYTFLVDANCSATFNLAKHPSGTIEINDGAYAHGFVASCDYPGYRFSRQEPTKAFQSSFHATGQSTFPISVNARVYPGNGGSLGVVIFEQNHTVTYANLTMPQTTSYNVNGTGHDLLLTWVPGGDGNKGFLATFRYGPATTDYFSVLQNPLVFDSRLAGYTEKVVQAYGSYIQVNVLPMLLGNIFFNDNSQSYSLHELARSPKSFKDFVHVSANLDASVYLAVFTCYNSPSERASMALDNYSLTFVDANVATSITIGKQSYPQAVSFVRYLSLGMWLGNIQMSDDCEVNLYASGIPSTAMKNKMLLYTFNSAKVGPFIRSNVASPSGTLVVPSNCDFSADIRPINNDLSSASLQYGANGFAMSPEYPGYENYDNPLSSTTLDFNFYKDAYLKGDTKFTVQVPNADPGPQGNLSISVTGTVKRGKNYETAIATLNIVTPGPDRRLTANGYSLEAHWNSTNTKTGFLLNFVMEKTSDSSSMKNLLSLPFILLLINFTL